MQIWCFIISFLFFKPLPSNPTTNHTAPKQPAFSPSLPEHVYQNCFGGAGGTADWNSSMQCHPLKFENLWDAAMMKSWNPSVLLSDSLPGEPPAQRLKLAQKVTKSMVMIQTHHCGFCQTGDMLGPPLADVPLPSTTSAGPQAELPSLPASLPTSSSTPSSLCSSSSSSSSSCSSSEAKEQKRSGAKKKCLYNFQDAFMENNRVVMATSASTSSVSCTATTVQSSNNPPIHLASKRPNSLGNIGGWRCS